MNSDCAAMSTPASSRRASLMGGTARGSAPHSSSASGCMIMDTPTPMITSTTVELAGLGSTVSR